MYNAPLYDHLRALAAQGGHRFHMPGHKGRVPDSLFCDVASIDYTELDSTGNLYATEPGIIQAAEREAARYFGAAHCFFLTCGATQGIKAALLAFCGAGGAVVLDRNCHQSASDALVALDLSPHFVYPTTHPDTGLSGDILKGELRAALVQSGATAALVTSPTYYGQTLDIAALADVAHQCGAALLVDSAHGTHFRACGLLDPLAQGADAVIFSAHKTAAALTQGAYLLLGKDVALSPDIVRHATAFFGTTSPSYPIMASLDWARAQLEAHQARWRATATLCQQTVRAIAQNTPFSCVPGGDPCRLSIATCAGGYTGYEVGDFLQAHGIVAELCDRDFVVCIVTDADHPADLSALQQALASLPRRAPLAPLAFLSPPRPMRRMSPRAAFFAPKQACTLREAAGKIAACNLSPYPPGVPVVGLGEEIDRFCIEYLCQTRYNDKKTVWVCAE